MQKVLIIGSRGFIGKHLNQYLKKEGWEVWEADIIVDYRAGEKYFLIDGSDPNYYRLFESTDYDICINCSGAASVPDSLEQPLRDYQLNTLNVFRLLEAIRQHQPDCRFINLSSAAVYGNPTSLPIHESSKVEPVSPYGFHKAMSERILREFYQFFGLKTCSLRIFSAYGEGLYKQLFWDLYKKAKADVPVKLYGTGKESRDFIYIRDLLQAIHLAADHAYFRGEVVNVANGIEISIREAVEAFYSCYDRDITYQFSGGERKGDPSNWVADIDILNSWGYQPKFSIKAGLFNYYQWVISNG